MHLQLLPFQAGPAGKLAITLQHNRTALLALIAYTMCI